MRLFALGLPALFLAGCIPPSAWNMPPIIGAARDGDVARLEQLLADGADPNVRAGVNAWTPLEHAIHKNQEGSVRVLLAHHADVNGRGGQGMTPLVMAAGYGYANIVTLLLEAGADPRLRAGNGVDPLTAAMSGVPDIDRFTVGRCQPETVGALLAADRSLRLDPGLWTRSSLAIAYFTNCKEVLRMIHERQERVRP